MTNVSSVSSQALLCTVGLPAPRAPFSLSCTRGWGGWAPSCLPPINKERFPHPVKASKACGQLAIWGSLVQMEPPPHDLPHQSPLCGWWWVYLTQSLFSCCHNIRIHPSANAHLDLKMPSVLVRGETQGHLHMHLQLALLTRLSSGPLPRERNFSSL